MKQLIIKTRTIILFLVLVGTGCEKEVLETDPSKIILGKWEITEMGNYPDLRPISNPLGYSEYLKDSVLREYEYETGSYFYKIYWIDSLLHHGIYRSDGFLVEFKYKYNFINNNNNLELERYNVAAMFNNSVYKRIK